jgi:hypothetical protein
MIKESYEKCYQYTLRVRKTGARILTQALA